MATLVDKIPALFGLFGGAILALAVGITYFAKAPHGAKLWIRALSSAFGPSLALLLVAAAFWWPEQYRYQPNGVRVFYWLQAIPLLLLAFTLARYPGPARLHWLLVPAGVFAWLWTFVLGWLSVHGE
jgi:hypothetical protein